VAQQQCAFALVTATAAALVSPDAAACGWDTESYHAEATSLPCVYDVVLGYYPRHTEGYYRTRIAAADVALAWAPYWAPALDDKGIALLKLGELEPARAAMLRRAEAEPDDYGTHANLGTLLTFTGEYAAALPHIDRAMAIEPQAHFGRERYHRQLVAFLLAGEKDPATFAKGSFLGRELTEAQRFDGSPAAFTAAGALPETFDALVSMIAVYGADRVSHLYFALADMLALHGDARLAWSAYKRASELGHPRKAEIKTWLPRLQARIERERAAKRSSDTGGVDRELYGHPGGYHGIDTAYQSARDLAAGFVGRYQEWEMGQLKRGLPVWRAEGLNAIYARQNLVRRRCKSPGVIEQRPAADATGAAPAVARAGGAAEPAVARYVAAVEAAAAIPGACARRPTAEAAVRAAHGAALAAATPALFQQLARDPALAARLRSALGKLTDAAMACRAPAARG
jgi:tetratricopeptide (TPR) repeat protein